MLECEGYRMFRGSMRIHQGRGGRYVQIVSGVWLYKPESGCWYCGGKSYPALICELVEDCGSS